MWLIQSRAYEGSSTYWSPCSAVAYTCSSTSNSAIWISSWSCCFRCSRRNLASSCCCWYLSTSCFNCNSSSCRVCCLHSVSASTANDALFAMEIVLGLKADDPPRDPQYEDFDRFDHARDLVPALLTESCGFTISLSTFSRSSLLARANHSSSVRWKFSILRALLSK